MLPFLMLVTAASAFGQQRGSPMLAVFAGECDYMRSRVNEPRDKSKEEVNAETAGVEGIELEEDYAVIDRLRSKGLAVQQNERLDRTHARFDPARRLVASTS